LKLILLGPPGSGKGTQAELLVQRLNIPAISTGNILREAINSGKELGAKAKRYIDAGKLVPDEVMVGIVRERLSEADCANGFILDGFPRTVAQAAALESMGVEIDAAVSLELSDDVIEKRMTGRRVCLSCGATYHIDNKPPLSEGVCDQCGQPIVQRSDDQPDTVRKRLSVYHESTEPVKGFYEKAGLLKLIVANGSIESITGRILAALGMDA